MLSHYQRKMRKDLNVIRAVRNAFAHSRKLLDFDDSLIVDELLSAPSPQKSKELLRDEPKRGPKVIFVNICLAALVRLVTKEKKGRERASKRAAKNFG